MPVITRAISVAADAAVLFFTLSTTKDILKVSEDSRRQATLTSTLLKNGTLLIAIVFVDYLTKHHYSLTGAFQFWFVYRIRVGYGSFPC